MDAAVLDRDVRRPLSQDRRRQLFYAAAFAGIAMPTIAWAMEIAGISRASFPHDKLCTAGVILAVMSVLVPFVNNPGERRTRYQQLTHFSLIFLIMNMFTNLLWEAPWFLLKQHFFTGNVGEGDVWFYPWWAYGVADTRYLTYNDLIVAVSAMDAAAALIELGVIFLYYKGYRAFASVMGILVAVCMLWGQYYFFISEAYNRFAAVGDGWFGLWLKFFGLSFWWLFLPAFAIVGFVWQLAVIFQKRGIKRHLAHQTDRIVRNFSDVGLLVQTDSDGNELPVQDAPARAKRWIALIFVLPLLFLGIDLFFYYL